MDTMTELARRAVACKHWKWMDGMTAYNHPYDYSMVVGGYAEESSYTFEPKKNDKDWLPDLTEPGTVGCLLALVREAWNSPRLQVSPMLPNGGWVCYLNDTDESCFPYYRGDTEAAALVAALEAAP